MKRTKLKGIEGVIFDFDGTLAEMKIDFPSIYTKVYELTGEYGMDASKLKETYLIEVIEEITSILGGEAGKRFYETAIKIVVAEELVSAREASLFPGTRELILWLKEMGIKVGIVTRNCAEAVLSVYPEVKREVDLFLPRDSVKRIKPDPQHLIEALNALRVADTRCLMVGDHPIDIKSAIRVNMIPVGVLTGHSTEEELLDAGAELILADATRLMDEIN
ncbi:MAG: HAD family phosphatase [Deltaproteobacteria bacterium]|uniref:HAD family phosphatase n=1 Tax=Candidatus Zymogenus saltonus TaxID=2844893 RepID=A0A9D8KF10_9DELT|nr:HAD family phosphatase [Candidatus Zymogenus saltonus]